MTATALERKLADRDRLYKPSAKKIELVDVPAMNFLMVDGAGDPNICQDYKDAVEALYSLSYTLKFAIKKSEGIVYRVGPLEGLWWCADMAEFSVARKSEWLWTMMIAQPPAVTQAWVDRAAGEVQSKKNPPALPLVRFEQYHEGRAAQIMHIGPYSAEGPTIAKLHAFIQAQGGALSLKHHEIYLGDPRKAAPEKLRTVIRQPFA